MEKIAIVSIIYNEPEWDETERCLDLCQVPRFYVDRKGVGSLAKAINGGFNHWILDEDGEPQFEYVWFVTNVIFKPDCLQTLLEAAERTLFAGVTPAFDSDHLFCRIAPGRCDTQPVPFIEFTAPLVRADVFKHYPLDENMPYWGHDLDWGYRVRRGGFKVGCCYDAQVGHVYIRESKEKNSWTARRWAKRKATNAATRQALINKYGPQWKGVVQWQ